MNQKYEDRGSSATMTAPKGKQTEGKDQQRGNEQQQPGDRGQQAGAKGQPDKDAMMKKAEEAGKPGAGHKALQNLVGNWRAEVKCWMEPNHPPHVSQGTAEASWTLSGRFLQEEFHGDMMGKPFEGRTLMGFDNVKQAFTSVWVSDMQTSTFVSEGKGENGNKTITLNGTSSCPIREQTDIPMKLVLRILGPDKHTLEMYDLSEGENNKTMEIAYTRK